MVSWNFFSSFGDQVFNKSSPFEEMKIEIHLVHSPMNVMHRLMVTSTRNLLQDLITQFNDYDVLFSPTYCHCFLFSIRHGFSFFTLQHGSGRFAML